MFREAFFAILGGKSAKMYPVLPPKMVQKVRKTRYENEVEKSMPKKSQKSASNNAWKKAD